jgi:hypothetical protein
MKCLLAGWRYPPAVRFSFSMSFHSKNEGEMVTVGLGMRIEKRFWLATWQWEWRLHG